MDEMNGYPADGLRALIKQISGLKPGDTISFAAWEGKREKVAPGFMFVGSANLLSSKHPDRPDLPNELKRELAPSSFEVDYPPQTPEDPEFFEMCLSALMDNNGRVRANTDELAPSYNELVDSDKKIKTFELSAAKNSGGALWRFAQMAAEIQRCYKLIEGAERIDGAPFDPGVALAWLAEYRKSAGRRGETLQNFLAQKLEQWVGGSGQSGQKLFSPPDIKRLREIYNAYGLDITSVSTPLDVAKQKILTSAEIGRLSPRVPRQPEHIRQDVLPEQSEIYFEDGSTKAFRAESRENFIPGTAWTKKVGNMGENFVFKGVTQDNVLIFEGANGLGEIFTVSEAKTELEKVKLLKIETRRTKEIRELFGQNFFGPEQVEKAFTIRDQNNNEVKLVDFSPEQRRQVKQMLVEKLNEPDIQAFLQKPENQTDIKNGKYLLILRAPQVGSIKKMFELLQPDMEAKGQGKLLFKVDWYATDSLFTSTTCPFEWKFVTKEVVPLTLGLQHQPMTEALAAEARRVGFNPGKIKRRAPVETVFDFLTVLRTTNGRILLNRFDWSDIRSSDGDFVYVGCGGSGGLSVDWRTPGNSSGDLGASLSR